MATMQEDLSVLQQKRSSLSLAPTFELTNGRGVKVIAAEKPVTVAGLRKLYTQTT